jgi:hypothetical protein
MDKLPRSKLYLENRGLEANPKNQKLSDLYQGVLNSLKKGPMINPILVVADGRGKYKILPDKKTETILNAAKDYKIVKV